MNDPVTADHPAVSAQTPPVAHSSRSPGTAPAPFFDAVLHPHRSLSARGFAALMISVAFVSFAAGIFFALRGAWPVFGFFGLDVALLYVAFRNSYRSGALFETVTLSDGALIVRRFGKRGETKTWTLEPYWLRVDMDDPPGRDSRLSLVSHGRSLSIGACLTPEEKLDFATALRGALARWRAAPRLDG